MSAFRGFVAKEFKQIYRDKRTLVVLFGMPVIMLIMFGFAIRNEAANIEIAVLDHARDEATQQIIQKLDASPSFILRGYIQNPEEVEQVFKAGNIKAVLVFEAAFASNLHRYGTADIQILTDATDPNLANLIQNYAGRIIQDYAVQLNPQLAGNQSGIQPTVYMMYNPGLKSVNLFVPGLIAVILMLISALMTSISITREKEMGNMEVLLVSPLKPGHIIIGKVLPYLLLSVINVLTIVILAIFVFKVPFEGSMLLFFAEALLFIMAALALGVLISSVAGSQQTAMMASLAGLLLPTVLLSGFIFPLESMPVLLQWISHVIPAKWFLTIVRGIMLKGAGLFTLWKETLMLIGMTAAFIAVSYKKFNVRLE